MKKILAITLLGIMVSCSQKNEDQISASDILIETDMDFSAMSVKEGMGAAFIAFADKDALILQEGQSTIEGIQQIREQYGQIPKERVKLSWTPIKAEIAKSRDILI